jgi:hypothetical protein
VDSRHVDDIQNIKLLTGPEATAKYGPDAGKGGAAVVTMGHSEARAKVIDSSLRQWLTKLGIQPERVDLGNIQLRLVRANLIGPNPMYVALLYLKAA